MSDSNSNDAPGGLPPPPPPMGDAPTDSNSSDNSQSPPPPPGMPSGAPSHPQSNGGSSQQAPPMQQQAVGPNNVSTEEYVEAVIEERWVDIEEDIRKIVDWKNRSEQRITSLSQQFEDLKDRFDKLHAALIGKIESYDKNILEVGAEMKAMEKVFSKVMPAFTDNVKQLDDISKRLKE